MHVKLTAIKVIFLRPNTPSILQPCDQGIIQNLKFHYSSLVLRKYLTSIETKQDFGVNIPDACHSLRATCTFVTSAATKKLFYSRWILFCPQRQNIPKKPKWNQCFVKY
jgi:hypothetical protein